MNNLYILHTQYNIILGSAVALNKMKGDCNDLIIYAEFCVSEAYRRKVAQIFDNVYYLRDKFDPLPKGVWNTEKALWKEYQLFRNLNICDKRYDHVFMSQERPLDSMILGYFKEKNPACVCSDIEEDCYYSSRVNFNDEHYISPKRKNIIHRFRKLIYGKRYLHETDAYFYGCSSFYDDYYVIYPDLLRPKLVKRGAKTIAITKEEISIAVDAIYGSERTEIPSAEKYYLFFFDLIERYKEPEGIETIVKRLQERAKEDNAVLLLKYHPRETRKFSEKGPTFEIHAVVPAEKLLCDLLGKNVVAFGNATTALIVANHFGFKSYCIAKINGSDNKVMMDKFSEMGIIVPETLNDIKL